MPIDEKPSRNEDEYFVKHDAELIKAMRARLDEQRVARERAAHRMKCPKCGSDLVEREYGDIKLDRCPDCAGAWFDAGELDILEHRSPAAIHDFFRSAFWSRAR